MLTHSSGITRDADSSWNTPNFYFLTADEVSSIIDTPDNYPALDERKKINIEKIRTIYNMEKNIDDYERLMMQACGEKTMIIKPAPARSI